MASRASLAATLLAAAGLFSIGVRPAQAVIVEAGTIETNGILTTADRFYFEVQAPGPIEISISELTSPVKIGRPSLRIYRDDGTLDAADLLFSADAPAAGSAATLNTAIAIGDYVALVSEFTLAPGAFGPLNPGALNPVGYDYEIGFSDLASNDTRVTCIAHGNLSGGFSTTERVAGGCAGFVAVTEPAAIGLLVVGMALIVGLHARVRRPVANHSTSRA
jgi:hypothetical protein